MKVFLRLISYVLLIVVFLCNGTTLAATDTVYADSGLCDIHNRVCASIRITFDINEDIMQIRGRMYRPAGEGTLRFFLRGITPLNEAIVHIVEIDVKGQYNEIIRYKFRPPLSNQTEWSLKEMMFDPLPK